MWNGFDIIEAYHAFYCDYHNGQWSPEYARLSRILTYYKPSPLFIGYENLSDNGKEIYNNLVEKHG